jgi:hypothetical protein
MKRATVFSLLREKISKAREIGLFYSLRYVDWRSAPELSERMFSAFQDERCPLNQLLFGGKRDKGMLADAERICAGELKVYDLEPALFRKGISWHKDYYTGYEWPLRPFNRIYDPNDSGADLNIPFEISRLQFAPTLAQAYRATHDIKYLMRLSESVDSWIKANPYGFGVNWWSCMDVALRAVSLVISYGYLYNHLTKEKIRKYRIILWRHALHIYKYEILQAHHVTRNNHFLGSMLGLLCVSLCFKGPLAEAFREAALRGFRQEVSRQFHEDGGNFESATGYHQYALELILVAVLFLKTYENNDNPEGLVDRLLGEGVYSRLCRGVNLVVDYMACYGESPHFGDSSDCRVLIFKNYFTRKPSDHKFLEELANHSLDHKKRKHSRTWATVYSKSGYALFRNERYGVAAFAGPKGTEGRGGHGHNDKCSFVFQVGGRPVFVDSGTYIYNHDTQGRFDMKRGRSHNIVMIDSKEQLEICSNLVFGMAGEINSEATIINEDNCHRIRMRHNGYSRFPDLGWVFREITCRKDSIIVEEKLEGTGNHEVSIYFNLHPEVKIEQVGNTTVVRTLNAIITITIPDLFHVNIEHSAYSASYHNRVGSRRIEAKGTILLPGSWISEIRVS